MLLIEMDRPIGGLPGPDQNRLLRIFYQFLKQEGANAFFSFFRSYIRMANQRHIRLILDPHDSDDFVVIDVTGKSHAVLDLSSYLIVGHRSLMQPIWWNHFFVSDRRIIDDIEDFLEIFSSCISYHRSSVAPRLFRILGRKGRS